MDWWIVVLIGFNWVFVAFILWLGVDFRQKSLQRRSEERLRVLERFSSAEELSSFLASERGGHFLNLFASRAPNPSVWIVAGTVVGILLACLGGAFIYLDGGVDDFRIPAVILVASAVGTLAATVVSYILIRQLGLMQPRRELDGE